MDAQSYDAGNHISAMVLKGNKTEVFQEKLLKTLEAPQTPKQQDYLNMAMAAMVVKIKSVLSNNEIMNLMEELEEIVNRVCRQKRRRLEGQNPTVPIQAAVPGMSTDNNYFRAPGLQGPMAVPLQQYNDDPQYYNF